MPVVDETAAGPPACTCGIGRLLAVARCAVEAEDDYNNPNVMIAGGNARERIAVRRALRILDIEHPDWREWS